MVVKTKIHFAAFAGKPFVGACGKRSSFLASDPRQVECLRCWRWMRSTVPVVPAFVADNIADPEGGFSERA